MQITPLRAPKVKLTSLCGFIAQHPFWPPSSTLAHRQQTAIPRVPERVSGQRASANALASSRARTTVEISAQPLVFCPVHKGEKSPRPRLSALARKGAMADVASGKSGTIELMGPSSHMMRFMMPRAGRPPSRLECSGALFQGDSARSLTHFMIGVHALHLNEAVKEFS